MFDLHCTLIQVMKQNHYSYCKVIFFYLCACCDFVLRIGIVEVSLAL